jgi:GR25 family glycosyltransferase involved in LPS biosynthesis
MNKINGIDKIVWINLERSIDRRIHMENLLKNINVPNTRIEAIDGLTFKREELIKKYNINPIKMLSLREICCTLSHIKAISSLKDCPGQYFMICEDDILFDNIKYINLDLKSIIKKAPKFDILMLYKNNVIHVDKEYLSWKEELLRGNIYDGAVCYIISKEGMKKFNIRNNNMINVSDRFIFERLNTIIYKYNLCSTLNVESTIHPHHIKTHILAQEDQLQLLLKKNNM